MPAAQTGQAYRPISGYRLGRNPLLQKDGVSGGIIPCSIARTLQLFPDADKVSYAGANVEIRRRLDGSILACYKGKILTPQDAPPLAAALRAKAKETPDYPALWKEPPPPKPPRVRKWRKRIGPLENDRFWWRDPVKRKKHSELTKAGMERARQAGINISIHKVEDREGFAEKFAPVLEQLERKAITRKQAAEKLGITGPTLKRVLDDRLTAKLTPMGDNERNSMVAKGV